MRWTIVFLLACASCYAFPQSAAGVQVSSEAAEQAFSKRNYPWYDATSGQVRKIEFPERPDAKSKDRHDVRLAPPTKNKPAPAATGRRRSGMSIVAWCLVALLIAGISGLLIWAFFRIESRSRKRLDEAPARSLAESIEQLPFQVDDVVGDFRALAQTAYAEGDYQRAITFLFSHVLVTLDQNGLIRLRKGKTNRQYLRELQSHSSLSNFYRSVMVPFEDTFFGDHELSQHEFEACWNRLDGFQDGVNQTVQVVS